MRGGQGGSPFGPDRRAPSSGVGTVGPTSAVLAPTLKPNLATTTRRNLVARIPDKKEHARRFAELPLADRRKIGRAVNRGQPVEKRAHAVFAVGVARRQQRFWRYAWLLGPVIGLVQLPFVEFEAALFNLAFGTLVLGAMAAYWHWRARQAEAANLRIVERSGGRGRGPGGSKPAQPKGHLPGETRKAPAKADDPEGDGSTRSDGTTPRPRQPRRKKRR